MRQLLILSLLACCPILLTAQVNKDSLWAAWKDEAKTDMARLEALHILTRTGYLSSQPDSASLLAKMAYDFAKTKGVQPAMSEAAELMYQAYEEKIADQGLRLQRERWVLLGGTGLLLALLGVYIKRRIHQGQSERRKLEDKIGALTERIATLSVASTEKRKEVALDKVKIEDAINTKLGESSWNILNLLFENPTISNKEIAAEVSLSVEGVSSSLRRMYLSFNITAVSNKKIALIMEVVRISTEE